MKKILLSLYCLLFFTKAFAQSQDLMSLAQGTYLGMNALFDEKENIFGYIAIYGYGKSGPKTKKFEYVVMDKNLNAFANNTFEGDITAADYRGYINFDGTVILKPAHWDGSLVRQEDMFTPSPMVIDLKTNTIKKKEFYDYDHGKFNAMLQNKTWNQNLRDYKDEKRDSGFNYVSLVSEIKEGGYIVLDYDSYKNYEKNCHVIRYDEHKKEEWRYDFSQNGSKYESEVFRFLEKDEQYIYAMLWDKIKREADKFYLVVIDMKTGKEVSRKQINGYEDVLTNITHFYTFSYGQLDNDKTFDDKIVIVGRIGSNVERSLGIARLLINKKTFDVELKTLFYEEDFQPYIHNINKYGYVERNFFLDPRDIFFQKDGSVGILFEKYKVAGETSAQKTTDLVYIYTDKDFKIAGTKVFEKEKSRWSNSDYLFSQNLNNGNDLVFFYRDYQKADDGKEKNWNLFINTLINGKFNQQVVPISSKDNFIIYPYIAKEGYILLHEYNKTAKYNQVRLERLNY